MLHDVAFETLPAVGDEVEDIELIRRAYLVVGVEEPNRGRTWGLTMERLEFSVALHMIDYTTRAWTFHKGRA